jgi:hypothetical protein
MNDSSKFVEAPRSAPGQLDSDLKGDDHGNPISIVLGGTEEKNLIRKLDLHIIPVVMTLYLLSFLDR